MDFCFSNVERNEFYSRAIDLEEEENEEEIKDANITFEWFQKTSELVCDELFIFTGKDLSDFIKKCLLSENKHSLVAKLTKSDDKEDLCEIYKLEESDKKIYFTSVGKIHDHYYFRWTSELIKNLCTKETNILLLGLDSKSSYRSFSPLPDLFVRQLKTSHHVNPSKLDNIPYLEQPNLFQGLPAEVFMRCECEKRKCRVLVAYFSQTSPSFPSLNRLLSSIQLPFKPVALETLLKQEKRRNQNDVALSLYI